jgi:hypothetical protein
MRIDNGGGARLYERSGSGGEAVFTGFDNGKLAAPLEMMGDGRPKSAKYTFAKLAQESGQMPQTKEEAEAWFNQHIKPGMEAAGFGVDWVKGDKAFIRSRENPEGGVVDFVRGAGSNDPSYIALAWQPETGDAGGGGGFAPASPNMFAQDIFEESPFARAAREALRRALLKGEGTKQPQGEAPAAPAGAPVEGPK